jgi:hypothetical protein
VEERGLEPGAYSCGNRPVTRIDCATGVDTVAGNAGTDVIRDGPSEIDEGFSFWAEWVDDD